MLDDTELLRRYTETGSEPAFTEFVGRHLNLVYFTALRSTDGDAALAEDVAQAVFAVAARRARALIQHATITGWLHTTTRYTAARARQKERTRQRYEREASMPEMITGDAEQDWTRLRPVIDDALDDLEGREREAILERFFEGRAFADLGAAWRISQDAARMRVDRALEKLRVALERRGVRSVSAALAGVLAAQGSIAAPAGMVATVSGAALAASATSSGVTAFFSTMSGTKIILGTAAVVMAFVTGTAVLEHQEAASAELRVDAANRELATLRAQLARATQQRSAAQIAAAAAEKDTADLLSAVADARTKASAAVPAPLPAAGSKPLAPDDPLAQTLQALFPNGVVARIGDRTITVEDVRREIAPQLPKVQQMAGDPTELRQRLYALQNGAIADLVTRELNIKEFHNPAEEQAKQIPSEYVDTAIADRIKGQFKDDQASFLAELARQGVTLAQYRQTVEEDIISRYMQGAQRRLTPAKNEPAKPPAP